MVSIRPTSDNNAFDPSIWETFVSTTLGLEVSILAVLPGLHNSPLAKCGCKKFCMDFHDNHTSTCTAHSGATKTHNWMVSVLGQLFSSAVRSYLRDQAVSLSLVFDLSVAHNRFGSSNHVQQNGSLSHPQDLDCPMCVATQHKTNT